jgi:hypothetical protein
MSLISVLLLNTFPGAQMREKRCYANMLGNLRVPALIFTEEIFYDL